MVCFTRPEHLLHRKGGTDPMDSSNAMLITEYQILAEFRYQLRCFLHFSERAARTAGLEPQQHLLLLAIKGLPPSRQPTIGTLAERLQIAHHSMVELIDRLVERDLIQRQRDESDQRRVLITLTPRGEEVLYTLALAHRAELRSSGPALVQTLTLLLQMLDTPTEDA